MKPAEYPIYDIDDNMEGLTSSLVKDPDAVSNFLCFAFFLFGICQLTPWNVFIKSAPYYGLKMGSNSRWAEGMGGYISFTFTGANFAGMVFWVLFGLESKIMGARGRVITGMTGSLVCLSLLGLLTWIDVAGGILFPSLMVLAGVSGLSVSLMTKGLFNLIACLPSRLTAFLVGGQAFAGLLVSLINIFCVLVQWDSNVTNSFEIALCFFIGTSIVACADLIFFILFCLSNRNGPLSNQAIYPIISRDQSKRDLSHLWNVFRSISSLSFGITSTLAATICIYATFIAATSSVPSNTLASKLRIPFLFAMYDFGDLIGRALPTIQLFTPNPKSKLLVITPWIRWIVFLPIFCFFPRSISPIYSSGTIASDIPYVLLCFLFALSNGYLCSVLIMSAPVRASKPKVLVPSTQPDSEPIDNPDEKAISACKEVSGSVMGLFLNFGLVTGAICSLLLTQLVG